MSPRADGTITQSRRHSVARIVVGAALVVTAAAVAWAARPGTVPSAWVARQAVPQHSATDPSVFELAAVSVPDPAVLWPTTLPPTGRAVRTIAPGEPVLAADLDAADGHPRVTLPVEPQNMPAELLPGDLIDVWSGGGATPLVTAAVVQSVAPADVGPGRVEIAVPAADVDSAVRAAATDRLILVRLP